MTTTPAEPVTPAGPTVPGEPAAVAEPRRRRRAAAGWVLLPAVAVLLVFFFYPLATIVWSSFTEPTVGLANYTALFTDGVSVTVLLRTLRTALIVALVALVVAYPYAYAMTRVSRRTRAVLTVLVLLPFWTSVMARNFAWYLLEQRDGLIDRFFSLFGIDGVVLLGSVTGVTVAMVQVMLPFMVLPLYSNLSSIDLRLMDAATSLGASRPKAFARVYLPLSLPGVVSGFSLVFIVTLGFFVTPALLGTPQQSLVSQVIETRVGDLLDFPGAGAMGSVLLAVTLVVLFAVSRIAKPTAALNQAVDRA
ncbi:putative spermidine/putrescine transport system permease protein [Saccharothrix tamanrassetensis]|uniref:Putative spermidine/putrescine transport system permease protein n=1 Tax=Saccharothrix tamanrassetensis TaxID=1051531 RepID=A0A841CLL5_9PSEU|nr:ABC transporter permease [Saccharothrix tamanrassetensis]MBB5956987.1 putative spermidine/putrescine transport system permease protein [Saccharothrix tamanrassetensis]